VRGLGTWLFGALESEQDRWFLWLPVLFGAGIALYFALPTEPSLIRATAAVTMALIVRVVWRHGPMSLLVGSALMAVVLGFAVGKLRSDWVAAPVLTAQIGPVEVRGWVELLEPRPAGGHRLTLLVAGIERLQAHERPARVRIRVSEGGSGLKPGDAISVRAMLSGPAGPALPGGYDFARSAWFQGLGGVGFALAPPVADPRLGEAPTALRARAAIERLRQAIGARVTTALPGNAGAIANALITGERGGISEATNQAFRDSGLLHILSISGLHMAIMAGAVFLSVRFLLALVPALALRFPIKKWAAAAATLGALGYLLISGASFPTVRSWIMISIMFLAVMLERPALALRNVALAALAILVLFPESLMDVSFQMSFAAVVALVAAYEIVRDRAQDGGGGRRGPWLAVLLFFGGIVLSTLVASLAVAPFAAYHFHKSQQYAVLANLIAIPICNVLVMPAALATLIALPLGLEWAPLQIMGWGIEGMMWCAQAVAALPGAVAAIPAIPTAAFALMLCGGLWTALWRTRWRLIGLCPIVLGLAVAPLRAAPDVLVGRDGTLVAVQSGKEGLSALAAKGGMFELARWLEHDGDGRSAESVAEARAFRCDGTGCAAIVKGRTIAVVRHAAALRDDCGRAAVIVLALPSTRSCADEGPIVIAQEQLKAKGTHALYFKDSAIEIETAADGRGQRPWVAATSTRGGPAPPARDDVRGRSRDRTSERWPHERSAGRHAPTPADEEP
jgi:competence protein ComEC